MIVAFFSPKGGAGRTTAVANCALEIARQGNRVLAVDFDLDAPSLHCFFGLDDKATLAPKHRGVVDLTRAFVDAASGGSEGFPGLEAEHLLAPKWKDLKTVRGKDIKGVRDKVLKVHPKADLHLLAAGRIDAGYRSRAASLHWGELYEQPAFREYVAWLRGRFEALADVTFVDARAGATDIGSLCAFALADLIVLCCPPTFQGLNTTFGFARRAAESRGDGAKGRCLFVASRVQRGADDRHLARWRASAIKGAQELSELWLVTRGQQGNDAAAAAHAMVERFEVAEVPVHAVGEPLVRVRMLEREEETDPLMEAWGPLLEEIRRQVPVPEPDHTATVKAAESALDEAVKAGKLDPLPRLYRELAAALWREGRAIGWTTERATRLEEVAARGIGVAQLKGDTHHLAMLYHYLGRARRQGGRVGMAEEPYQMALTLHRQLDSHHDIGTDLHELAELALEAGAMDKARILLEEAATEKRRAAAVDRASLGATLWWLGYTLRRAGDFSGAKANYEAAIQEYSLSPEGPKTIPDLRKNIASLPKPKE